jgi:hypothetical protein
VAKNTTNITELTEQDKQQPNSTLSHILRSVLNLKRLLQEELTFMGTKSNSSESLAGIHTLPEIPVFTYAGVMPRPGQSRSLDVFTSQNASDYLEEFNVECELYCVKPKQRVLLFPHYCIPTSKDVVKLLPGYDDQH